MLFPGFWKWDIYGCHSFLYGRMVENILVRLNGMFPLYPHGSLRTEKKFRPFIVRVSYNSLRARVRVRTASVRPCRYAFSRRNGVDIHVFQGLKGMYREGLWAVALTQLNLTQQNFLISHYKITRCMCSRIQYYKADNQQATKNHYL